MVDFVGNVTDFDGDMVDVDRSVLLSTLRWASRNSLLPCIHLALGRQLTGIP